MANKPDLGGNKMKLQLTKEQQDIITTDEDLKVNAVAGSGKTTTLLYYAGSRPFGKTILYLVFNKSAKNDAEAKFRKHGIRSVVVQTAHSLAFRDIMSTPFYQLTHKGYNSHKTMINMNIAGPDRYALAAHVNLYMSAFCNSPFETLEDLDYMSCVTGNNEARNFVKRNLTIITEKTQKFWNDMDNAQLEVTHEFYLKKYQLSKPQLPYDYILFDEGQDASPVMLDVFMNQNCTKVIVGDTHQQIYSWRGAVNSLEMVNFKHLELSKSFRFGKDIENIAKKVIAEKGISLNMEGCANYFDNNIHSEAVVSRTNICLLQEMINYVENNPEEPIYFEGNINSLIYTDEGVSIWDIVDLYNCRADRIKNSFIKSFATMNGLEEYIAKSGDREIGIMVKLVRAYGSSLKRFLEKLRDRCVLDKDDAMITFCTAHKSKGLEWDKVTLTDDFDPFDEDDRAVHEEINILYVAVTRAKKSIVLPEGLEFYIKEEACPERLKDFI